MNDDVLVADQPSNLSQTERVLDIFVAPEKTFSDILRSTSWWLPFVLMVVFWTAATIAVDHQVGFSRVAENQVNVSPKLQEQFAELTPDQRTAQMNRMAVAYRYSTYGTPVIVLVMFAIYALILLATFNFGLGARVKYGEVFAVSFYASLPYLLLVPLLTILTVCFGGNAEGFNLQNPVGTNLAYYLPDAAPWLKALLAQIDVIRLWTLGLTVLGMKIVSKRSMGQAAAAVIGWWLLVVLVSVVAVAAFS